MKYKVAQIPSVGMMVIEDENGILLSTAEVAGLLNSLEQRIAAANGRLEEYEEKICNCRWEGETQVRQCEFHEAHVDAIHEWAERAKVAEQRLAAAESELEQLTICGWLFQDEYTRLTEIVDNWQIEKGFEWQNPRWKKIHPVYRKGGE